jgi:hypothetical protein
MAVVLLHWLQKKNTNDHCKYQCGNNTPAFDPPAAAPNENDAFPKSAEGKDAPMTALSISYDGKIPLAPTCFVSIILALIAEACGTCISGIIEGRTAIAAMPSSMCNDAMRLPRSTRATSAVQNNHNITDC